tara:strand:+ start:44291 stop:45358 length:1068 start_codon:yes stop_codon:yes gene_type:complete
MNISARFLINRGDFSLDIDLDINAKGIISIYGPSGSGKTTLLRTLAGLEKGDNGYIQIGNQIWQDKTNYISTHKRAVGFVTQESSLFPHLNVKKNIEYGFKRIHNREKNISVNQIVSLLEINHLLERNPKNLSGGEKQKVAIAQAIALNPNLLLLDEPLSALDESNKKEIFPYLKLINKNLNLPVIYVTHDRNEIIALTDIIILLDHGKIKATGQIKDLFSSLELSFAHEKDALTIIEADVIENDKSYGLTILKFKGGRFIINSKPLQVGTKVRLQVFARDISITLQKQRDTSILNILPVIIDDLSVENDSVVTIRLMANETPLLARLTRKSVEELNLKPKDKVFAQVKTIALLA